MVDGEGDHVAAAAGTDVEVRVGDWDGFLIGIFIGGRVGFGIGILLGLSVGIAVGAQECAFTVPRESIRDSNFP